MFSNAYKAYLIALSLTSLSFASPVPDSPDAGHSITPSSNATDIVSGGSSSSDVAPVAADLVTNSTLVAPQAADVAPAADTGPTSDLNITNTAVKTGTVPSHGAIYAHWLSIGGTRSVVGYPIDDEHSTGTHGGRTQTFSNGYIYSHAGSFWVHVGPIPNSLSFSWPNIHIHEVSGWSTITLNNNGKVRWQSFLHDSRPWKFDWSISWVLVDADKTAISLAQHGTVGPNYGWFGKHNSNVDKTIDNAESAEIRNNWRAWVASTQWKSRADTTWAWKALIHDLWVAYQEAGPLISLLT